MDRQHSKSSLLCANIKNKVKQKRKGKWELELSLSSYLDYW